MKFRIFMNINLLVLIILITANQTFAVTHTEFQAVHSNGTSSFDDNGPVTVTLEGIMLNNPELWLDPTADETIAPWFLGGEWEFYIQGEGQDHAGTSVWIGQNYANGPGYDNYTNEQWLNELCRINRDPNTGYVFTAGDRVRVTGRYLFYKGKLNINENHEIFDNFNFTIELLEPAVGLPQPEPVELTQLKGQLDEPIFDPTRQTGCEYYQSRLIRINDVNIVDPENWSINQEITVRDSNGLTFPVLLCLGKGIERYPCPTGQIDVIGIMDQLAPGTPPQIDCTKGYRLLVLNYDGNGLVLTDRGTQRGNLPGDINHDFVVDYLDFVEMAENWLQSVDGLYGCQ